MEKRIKISTYFLLLTIFFVFAHSELDILSPENHLHDSHDFCNIVEKAKVEESFISFNKLFQLESTALNTILYYSNINFYYSINTYIKKIEEKNIPDYIVNNILLI